VARRVAPVTFIAIDQTGDNGSQKGLPCMSFWQTIR